MTAHFGTTAILRRKTLLITISGKHIEITEAMKTHAEEKTASVQPSAVSVQPEAVRPEPNAKDSPTSLAQYGGQGILKLRCPLNPHDGSHHRGL